MGKTWLLQNFGFQEYESVAYINCESATIINQLFADYDTKRIIRALSAYTNVDIVPDNSLIIRRCQFLNTLLCLNNYRDLGINAIIAQIPVLLGFGQLNIGN